MLIYPGTIAYVIWKHVKCRLRTKYYNDFAVFKETIDSITDSTDKSDKAIVDRLIGEKVQLFDTKVFDNSIVVPSINKVASMRKMVA